ncbi:MAG: hypothetical protein OXI54_11220 [Chloroflexota bacterium]|nr:hypothetical protein [Chloroflexota bacterium]MDE2684702.1 hypothetical protein [Chloroflexota bacterium]
MATITKDITDQVAAIIGDTLNGWFQPHLNFDPIVVRQRYDDWYGEDYLEAWIVWEGNHDYMDHSRINDLPLDIEPELDELGVNLSVHQHYVAKWEWDLIHEKLLK